MVSKLNPWPCTTFCTEHLCLVTPGLLENFQFANHKVTGLKVKWIASLVNDQASNIP